MNPKVVPCGKILFSFRILISLWSLKFILIIIITKIINSVLLEKPKALITSVPIMWW